MLGEGRLCSRAMGLSRPMLDGSAASFVPLWAALLGAFSLLGLLR